MMEHPQLKNELLEQKEGGKVVEELRDINNISH